MSEYVRNWNSWWWKIGVLSVFISFSTFLLSRYGAPPIHAATARDSWPQVCSALVNCIHTMRFNINIYRFFALFRESNIVFILRWKAFIVCSGREALPYPGEICRPNWRCRRNSTARPTSGPARRCRTASYGNSFTATPTKWLSQEWEGIIIWANCTEENVSPWST